MNRDESKLPHRAEIAQAAELAELVNAVVDYAIFFLSPSGEIRAWNHAAEQILGYAGDEMIEKNFSIFYGPEDLASRKPQRELEVAASEGRVEDEGWRIRKDGTRFWANTIITALRHKDGSVRGFAKVTRNLTNRLEAAEKLRQSEEMLRLLVESVKDYAIYLLDINGRVATWNEGAHRLKGYRPEEIIGRHFSQFYTPEDVARGWPERNLAEARRCGSVEDEGWRLRKDGSRFWADAIITAVHDTNGELRGFAKVTRDITERKRSEEMQKSLLEQREARLQAEEERRRADASYRVAQEANRAKDEFLMTLSHELRTPMTAILGWTRLLPTLSPAEPAFADAVAAIARSARLQAHLIDDVLDVSRIMSGKLRLQVENVDLTTVLNAAIDTVRPSASAKMITIATAIAPGIGMVSVDPARLQQVLWNLLTNAVKFTGRDGTIQVSTRRTSSHFQVTVSDTGEGIDPQFLPHIFELFRQADSSSTRAQGGLGLGLSIVRHIAEAHGGTVFAQSEGRGRGASFTVTIPIAAIATSQRGSIMADESEGELLGIRDRLAGLQVLLVDDDVEGRQMVCVVLEHAGAKVTAVASAEAAMKELAGNRPHILITDIAMPVTDGYTLAREIRKHPEYDAVKLVALSAFPAGRVASELSGFTDYLSKPIDPADLVEAVARVRDGTSSEKRPDER